MADINQWRTGEVISASRLNEMVDAINNLLRQQLPEIDASNLITTEQLTSILRSYSDVGHTHHIREIVDLVLPTVPTKLSQLENDSDYATITQVNQAIDNAQLDGSQVDLTSYAKKTDLPTKTSQLTNDSGFITEHQDISGKADKSYVDTELAKKSDKTHTHSYNDLSDKPAIPSVDDLATKKELTDGLAKKSDKTHTHDQYLTEHQDISNKANKSEIPTKTSQLTNDNGFITTIPSEYITESELNTELSTKANKSDIPSLEGYATETYVQNKIAEAQLSGEEVDLSGYATKGELKSKADIKHTHTMSNITDLVIPDVDKAYVDTQLNTKANKSDIPNLDGYALKTEIPTVPTKVSDLTNDSNFISSIPKEYVTETELNAKGYLTEHQDISGKADKSEIPTKTSQLKNDSGFMTSVPSEYVTETELNAKGYLTQHQDISGKVDKINGKGLSTNDYTTEEKNKLNGIEENANNYSLPIASSTVLGGVKIGSGLSIDSNGVLSSNVPSLEGNALTFGNYTIKYNETDDTLDFLYNGVIEEPPVEENSYVTDRLSMYIDANDVATYGSVRNIVGNYTVTNNGVSLTSDNKYLNFISSESDYIDTDLVPNLSTWSAELYFHFTATLGADTQVILCWGQSGSKMRIGYSDSAAALVAQSNNESNYTISNVVSDLLSPHHLIVTMNNGALTSYLDGVKNVLCTSGAIQTSHTGTLKMGCKYNKTEHFANINLRMFRFYDGKVLSDAEALQNYNYEINRG